MDEFERAEKALNDLESKTSNVKNNLSDLRNDANVKKSTINVENSDDYNHWVSLKKYGFSFNYTKRYI